MALRQLLCIRGLRHVGKLHNNNFIDLSSRHRLSFHNQYRLLRSRPNQPPKQKANHRSNSSSSPFEGYIEPTYINPDAITKAALFTVAFSAGSFIGVTIWEYEKIRNRAINAIKNSNPMNWLRKKQTQKQQTDLEKELDRISKEIEGHWNQLTAGQKVFFPILALNVAVYAMWRIPRLKPTMLKYFCSNPASKAICWPMFLSTFSHYSAFHLFANMYVLHSFSSAVSTLGREQFVGLYLTAGVVASLSSFVFKFITHAPGYSLGASGAIMCVIAYICSSFPETKLSILFLPQIHFSAQNALTGVMLFDLLGVVFRWRIFDHAAHLGGACVGLFWTYYGHHIWPLREHFVGYWHQLRGKTIK